MCFNIFVVSKADGKNRRTERDRVCMCTVH